MHNPPPLDSEWLQVRDAQYETEAVLSYFLNHANTPPFVAYRMIQRFGVSNPSPRYIEAVATAFADGVYGGFGNGTRGDMAATVAAILLDREAKSTVLDVDPGHGSLREPLLKIMHVLRAMELEMSGTYGQVRYFEHRRTKFIVLQLRLLRCLVFFVL